MKSDKKIGVVDFGGQYAHLIASRIRRLGAYSEIISNEENLEKYSGYSGLILSGGPGSVYEKDAPLLDPGVLTGKRPVLGICYGHQLLMKLLGGEVEPSNSKEYGPAVLEMYDLMTEIGKGLGKNSKVWMSHGDEVVRLPAGFVEIGRSKNCNYAFVQDATRNYFGIQFHPEVTHTEQGNRLLANFIDICGISGTWNMDKFLDLKIREIQDQIPQGKKVFMLISGGVDSTVSYLLLARALGHERVRGLLVDTGFMRKNEVAGLKTRLEVLGVDLHTLDESDRFYKALDGKRDPEEKRKIIGNLFIECQEDALKNLKLDPDDWILGQGTIYPDTIESGGTKHAQRIKTHHNRVEIINRLIEEGKVIEPIKDLYKDEVRELGNLLGLDKSWTMRHPFPGPGLAVRMIAGDPDYHTGDIDTRKLDDITKNSHGMKYKILPVRSVGVQGDIRTYASCITLNDFSSDWNRYDEISTEITNFIPGINRVLFIPGDQDLSGTFAASPINFDKSHSDILREADSIVTDFLIDKSLIEKIWQMPVVLIPVGKKRGEFSIVLRPVESTEAMTANFFRMEKSVLLELVGKILLLEKISYVFYDITHKPPGTIEWE